MEKGITLENLVTRTNKLVYELLCWCTVETMANYENFSAIVHMMRVFRNLVLQHLQNANTQNVSQMMARMNESEKCLYINEVLKNMNVSEMIERMNEDKKCLYIIQQIKRNMNTYVSEIGDVERLPGLDLDKKLIDEWPKLMDLNESINLQIHLHPSMVDLIDTLTDGL